MYNYYAIDMQSNADGTGGVVPYGFVDKGECEDKFLDLRKIARRSSVLIHTIMFIDNRGNHMEKPAVYIHPVEETPIGG